MSRADEIAEQIEQLLEADGLGLALLRGYRIGDQYEAICVALSLAVSRDHLPELRREGDVLRGTAFFPTAQVPEEYRDRVTPTGVVPIGIEILLDDVTSVRVIETGPSWREDLDSAEGQQPEDPGS